MLLHIGKTMFPVDEALCIITLGRNPCRIIGLFITTDPMGDDPVIYPDICDLPAGDRTSVRILPSGPPRKAVRILSPPSTGSIPKLA